MQGHIRLLVVFGFVVALVCGLIAKDGLRDQLRFGGMMFGGFLAYAVAHIVIGTLNGVRPSPDVRGGHDLVSVLAVIALDGVLAQLHAALIRVPVFQLSRARAPPKAPSPA